MIVTYRVYTFRTDCLQFISNTALAGPLIFLSSSIYLNNFPKRPAGKGLPVFFWLFWKKECLIQCKRNDA